MRYYIDGYNLLFRCLYKHYALSEGRQRMLEELSRKSENLNLNITIIFDAQHRLEGTSWAYLRYLEIIFTKSGETADELILEKIQSDLHVKQKTVVTSDRKLASQVRHCRVKTESVEEFLSWLNQRYRNYLRKTAVTPPAKSKQPLPEIRSYISPPPTATFDECFGYYLETFQASSEE